jgi:hypothetical protein
MPKSTGLMILLVHLKFCWRFLNLSGTVFEAKLQQQKTRTRKILLLCARKYRHSPFWWPIAVLVADCCMF